jgi:hypothetical protein
MELKVHRRFRAETYTIGTMFVDGARLCDTLEDTDRGLRADMPLSEIKAKKKYGITAIPTGRYKIKMSYWAKYRNYYPELCNVPGFTSILIHGGKNASATLGCVLVGENKIKGGLINSGDYMAALRPLIDATIKAGKEVWITVE